MTRKLCVAALLAGVCMAAVAKEECTPTLQVESGETLRLRPHVNELRACTLDEAAFRGLVARWVLESHADDVQPRWLFAGRLVQMPWLSRRLAAAALADPAWDGGRGRPRSGNDNSFVAALLSTPALLQPVADAFSGSRHAVVAATVEKVLIGPAADIDVALSPPQALLPFDAQVWYRLAPRAP